MAEARASAGQTSGPLVSIVILTRDGAKHLERLFAGLERTAYQPFEVIVVDNASTDSTADVLAIDRPFPIRVISNDRNVSFSEGNNQGAEIAAGEHLLFLNNDVEPINPGWLGAMVDTLESDEGVVATGAVLVFPSRVRSHRPASRDPFRVQARGGPRLQQRSDRPAR
jgi:GT2 family glycosyltransferase